MLDDEALFVVGICGSQRIAFRRHIASDSSRLLGRPSSAVGPEFPVDRDLVLDLVAVASTYVEPFIFTARCTGTAAVDLVIVRGLTFWHSCATLQKMATRNHLTSQPMQPTTPLRNSLSSIATTPCCGLSLSR